MSQFEISLAICPPPPIIKIVKELKDDSYKLIGHFRSRGANAHLSLCSFMAEESQLQGWKKLITRFCKEVEAFEVYFSNINYFTKTVYIEPNEISTMKLKILMQNLNWYTANFKATRFYAPHITIANNLDPYNLSILKHHFINRSIDFNFMVDRICVRKQVSKQEQYFTESEFLFSGKNGAMGVTSQQIELFS